MTLIPNLTAGGAMRRLALACLASALILGPGRSWGQASDSSGSSSTATGSGSTAPASGNTANGAGATDQTMESPAGEARVPPPTSLSTGQPLWSAISPLRWGHLSLLSASAIGIYDGNYQLAQQGSQPASSEIGMLQFLAVISVRKSRYALDLQYMPSMWYANGHLNKDWFGNEVSFQTAFALSPRNTLLISDHFSYYPQRNPLTGAGFSADLTNFLLAENPFLAQGTKTLINTFNAGLQHVIDSRNKVNIDVAQTYISLTAPPLTPKPTIICLPGLPFCFVQPGPPPTAPIRQFRPGLTLTGTWTYQWDARNTLTVNYSFERDWLRGTYETDTEYQHIGVGYTRRVTETVTAGVEAGPTFSATKPVPVGRVSTATGLQGTANIFKVFKQGGIVGQVSRNYSFSGVFSDSAHTTFDVGLFQRLHNKWGFNVGASYIIQEFSNAPRTYGYTAWAGTDYALSRSWSVFSGWHYLHTSGSVYGYAPRNSISGGIRWGWSPESRPSP